MRPLKRSVALLCTLALFATMLSAQQTAPAKRPLTHQDYDSWRSITASQVSRDGKFVAYAYMPQDGDGEIVVRNIATGADWRAPRGYRPPVPPPDDPGTNFAEFQAEQARLVRPVFTADSRFVVFTTEPTKAEVNKAKKEKKKPEDMVFRFLYKRGNGSRQGGANVSLQSRIGDDSAVRRGQGVQRLADTHERLSLHTINDDGRVFSNAAVLLVRANDLQASLGIVSRSDRSGLPRTRITSARMRLAGSRRRFGHEPFPFRQG